MSTPDTDLEEEVQQEESLEVKRIPPTAPKISKFGPPGGSKFGKGATSFNPPNKQRPGRAAGRGR